MRIDYSNARLHADWKSGLRICLVCISIVLGMFIFEHALASERLTVLYTNDVHCGYESYPTLAAYKESLKSGDDRIILIDGGDFTQGSLIANLDEGASMIEMMNQVGYDYAIPGNHDYDHGMEAFIRNAQNAGFQWLSCNFSAEKAYDAAFRRRPYALIDVGKHRVALIGIEWAKDVEADIAKVQKAIDGAVSENADFVIAIGHTGGDAIKIIAGTKGIDLFLNAHDHVVSDGEVYSLFGMDSDGKAIPVYETGTGLKYAGRLDIDCAASTVRYTFALRTMVDLESEIETRKSEGVERIREGCRTIVEKCDRTLEPFRIEIGSSDCTLCVYDPTAFPECTDYIEYNSSDFISDAFRRIAGTDIGILGIDSMRMGLYPGKTTKLDIYNLYPWLEDVYAVELTGEQIVDILEYGLRNCPEYTPVSPAVSGMTFTLDTSVPWKAHENKRVRSVMIGGKPLNPTETYTVAGSSYFLFEANRDIIHKRVEDCKCIGSDIDIIVSYIQNDLNGVISRELYGNFAGAGRITLLPRCASVGE